MNPSLEQRTAILANHPILQEISLSPEASTRIRSVLDSGVGIDQYGLIIPRLDRQILSKFCADILQIRSNIIEALRFGKHILYLPGSYDLVHAGHASFIQEAAGEYCKNHGLSREQLFIVALADDDELISTLKNSPGKGEQMPRPIESLDLMGHITGEVSPRLIDLASLPDVDLVGILPSPSNFGPIIRHNVFQSWLNVAKSNWKELMSTGDAPPEFSSAFSSLLEHLDFSTYGEVATAYRRVRMSIDDSAEHKVKWRIQDWHFMLHQFLGDVDFSNQATNFQRVISIHDSYADDVERCMASCGIRAFLINDTDVISTSALIKKYGWEVLKNQKLSYLTELGRMGLLPFSLVM